MANKAIPVTRQKSVGRRKVAGSPVSRRPVDFDAAEALIEATAELLSEANGVEPSVIEIAQRANVNPGLIGYYYGSKDGLFMRLLTRDMEKRQAQLRELIAMDVPVVDKIKMHISGLINMFFRRPYVSQLMLMLINRGSPDVASEVTEHLMRPITNVHTTLIEQGVASGELRAIDPMLFYFTVLGACDRIFSARYSLKSIFGRGEIDAELKRRFIEHTINMLLPGMLADPADAKTLPSGLRLSSGNGGTIE